MDFNTLNKIGVYTDIIKQIKLDKEQNIYVV